MNERKKSSLASHSFATRVIAINDKIELQQYSAEIEWRQTFMNHPEINQQITFLYTQDLYKTSQFYEQLLGLNLKLDQDTCKIYTITRTSYIGFCRRAAGDSKNVIDEHPDVIFTIVTDEVDEWYAFLVGQGVDFEKPPAVNPNYNIYHCFLRDPNGYLIEIQKFLDPAWS
jgi:catechol 2,3-dioxygenase-like lactoylglutathione lyase family enzyme